MSGLHGTLGFLVSERRLVDEEVGTARMLDRRGAWPGIASDDHVSARSFRSDKHRRLDDATVLERNRLTAVNLTPQRAFRNAKLLRLVGIESSLSSLLDQ